jgi:tetratricopeptide (TPR) repeat protein
MISRENTVAMTGYAIFYLAPIDRIPHAIRLYTDAENRDPLHAGIKANLAFLLLWSGDAEAAILKAREALELNPQHFFALMPLIDAYWVAENYPAALDVVHSLPIALQQDPRFSTRVALCYASQGDYVKARKIYRDVVETTPSYHVTTVAAGLALNLGEVEEAIDLMERGVENKSWTQFFIRNTFRHNDAVKDNPRYLALLKRIGLDDESVAALHRKMSFD